MDGYGLTVELCKAAGLIRGEAAFVDSTLMRANAALSSLEAVSAHQPPPAPRPYVERLFDQNATEEVEEPALAKETELQA